MALSRRHVLTSGLGMAAAAGLAGALDTPALAATAGRQSRIMRWQGTNFPGTHRGTAATTSGLVWRSSWTTLGFWDATARRTVREDMATWTGPVVTTGVAATELVASWNVATPVGAAVRVRLRAQNQAGTWSRWFTMATWASSSATTTSPTRTTYNGQYDAVARIATDTLKAASGTTLRAYQVQVDLLRATGTTVVPTVRQVAVVASTAVQSSTPVSAVGVGRGKVLNVPAYSQMLHVGHYPAWNGGGEAWCSPTSTAMVLDYWGRGATATETAWVRPTPHTNPQVEQVVRGVWDAGYQGTGNWPFNVAYAHARGLYGFVTRLRSLAEAELFIAAGIPLVVSTSFSSTQLTGAGFGTNGHLMVLRGFDSYGNVRVNDPASGMKASNSLVPRTYRRWEFESAWGRSGGLTYVMYPAGRALPAKPSGAAW